MQGHPASGDHLNRQAWETEQLTENAFKTNRTIRPLLVVYVTKVPKTSRNPENAGATSLVAVSRY